MISIAIREGVQVVDATDTLQAFHMTGADGSYAGHRKQDGAALHNTGMFQQRDVTGCIFTSCAHYRTVWQLNGPRQGAGRGWVRRLCIGA